MWRTSVRVSVAIAMTTTVAVIGGSEPPVVEAAGVVSLGGAFDPLVPSRLLDTRPGETTIDGQFQGIGTRPAGSITELTIAGRGGVSPDASAAALNVTVTGPHAPGYITVWPCDQPQPNASSVNYQPGQTTPNAVISQIAANGTICLYTLATTELIVDVNGAFALGSAFNSLVPSRLLDTRPGETTIDGQFQGIGTRPAGSITELTIAGRGGVSPDASAAALNVTVTGPHAPGYITVWPCDQPQPNASSVNYQPGQTTPNAVISQIAANGTICLYTLATTELIVDVNGAFALGSAFNSLVPSRLLDTRPGETTIDGQFQGIGTRPAGSITELTIAGRGGVSPDASAAALNVTVTGPHAPGYITVWPCDQPQPNASSVNYQPGQTTPNAVISQIAANGTICLYTLATTELIVDVNGAVNDEWSMDVTPADGTVIVGGSDVIAVAATSETGGTVTLAPNAPVPIVGGQLVVVPHPLTMEGVVGEVIGVTEQADGSHVVTLAATTLGAAFSDMRYSYDGPLTEAGGPAVAGLAQAIAHPDAVSCSGGLGGSVVPTLNVQFTGGAFDLDVGVLDPHFLVRLDGVVDAGFAANLSGSFSCSLTLPGVTFIVPFATIDLVPVLSITVSGEIGMSAQASIPFSVGVEADRGGVRNLSTVNPSGSGSIDSNIQVTAGLRAGIEPQLKFLGIAGGTLNLGVNLNANVLPFDVPCATITANASVEFGVEIGRWGFDWNLTLATLSFPEITLYEERLGCPASETAWVGTMSTSVDLNRATLSWNGKTDTWENDHQWTVSSSTTDLFTGNPTFGPGGDHPADMDLDWSNVLFHNRYVDPSIPVTWQCEHVAGPSMSGSFSARLYDTSIQPVRTPAPLQTVYIRLLASYTGAPQTFTGDAIASCPSSGSGPLSVPQAGLTRAPDADYSCLPGTIKAGGECLVVAQVSADGTRIDVELSMTGVYTTMSAFDGNTLKHRVNTTAQHVSIHVEKIEI